MSRQYWSEQLAWATADGTTISNSALETIIFPAVTIPANFMQDGRTLRLTASGRYSNVVTAVPTLTFAVKWGGVAAANPLATSPAIVTSASAVTNAPWFLEVLLQTRSNGSSGTIFAMGQVTMTTGIAPTFGTVANYGVTASMNSTGLLTPAAVTADLTGDTALVLTGKWSVANASNAFTGHLLHIEALN